MRRSLLALAALAAVALPCVLAVHVSEFDGTVRAIERFAGQLEAQEALEAETDQHLDEEDFALLELAEGEETTNPSYTLPYPAVTAAYTHGQFFHPGSYVNPLAAQWHGFAPVARHPFASAAAVAGSPISAYLAGALQPQFVAPQYVNHPAINTALGINTALYPAQFAGATANAKGGYNVHGLSAGNVWGGYHPGLAGDLKSLGGKASGESEEEESLLETEGELDSDAELQAEAAIDADVAALTEEHLEDQAEVEAEEQLEGDVAANAEAELDVEAAADAEAEMADAELVEMGSLAKDDDEERPEHPTYVLPYPPVLPGHYTPLFNPYTNVNPLSTPFANYAAQAGAHPGVAAAAAAQAGALASVNGQIAGAAGGYPYYPFAARNPVIAGQLQGNPVPFSGYAGWIHPQNLNSAAVGENEELAEGYPALVEVETESNDAGECQKCSYSQ